MDNYSEDKAACVCMCVGARARACAFLRAILRALVRSRLLASVRPCVCNASIVYLR